MKKIYSPIYFIMFLSFFIVSRPLSAQLKQAEITCGAMGDNHGYSMVQTKDGGYAITGFTDSTYKGENDDIYVVKLDSDANLQWSKSIGGKSVDIGESIIQTKDGGYAITGYTYSFNDTLKGDVYIVKLDSTGKLQWTKTIGGKGEDAGYSIIQTREDAGYVIVGSTYSFGDTLNGDVYVIKLDSTGKLLWTKTIGGKGEDAGNSIIQTADGGFAIVGFTNSFGDTINGDVYVIKLDYFGDIVWTRTIGGKGGEGGTSITQTADQGYAITGGTNSFVSIVGCVYVIKLDFNGNLEWTKVIGDLGLLYDYGNSIVQTTDKGYFIVGSVRIEGGTLGASVGLIRLDEFGNVTWAKSIGDTWDFGTSIVKAKDGGYGVAGSYFYDGTNIFNVLFIKLDADGNSCQTVPYIDSVGTGGSVSSGGNITSINKGIVGSGGGEGTIVKGTEICKIFNSISTVVNPDRITEIFPNPSSGLFTISTDKMAEELSIDIYNVLGMRIYKSTITSVSKELNLTNQPKGIYFYRVRSLSGSLVGEGKLIID